MQINKIITRRSSAGTVEDTETVDKAWAKDRQPADSVDCTEAGMEVDRAWDKVWDMAENRKVDRVADTVSRKAVDNRMLADRADTVVGTAMDKVWDRKWDRWMWDNRSERSRGTATDSSNRTRNQWRQGEAPTSRRSGP